MINQMAGVYINSIKQNIFALPIITTVTPIILGEFREFGVVS